MANIFGFPLGVMANIFNNDEMQRNKKAQPMEPELEDPIKDRRVISASKDLRSFFTGNSDFFRRLR